MSDKMAGPWFDESVWLLPAAPSRFQRARAWVRKRLGLSRRLPKGYVEIGFVTDDGGHGVTSG